MVFEPNINYMSDAVSALYMLDALYMMDDPQDALETSATSSKSSVGCLLEGTLILTEQGYVAVEDLKAGMRIMTRDSGLVPLTGIGGFTPSIAEISVHPALQTIVFPKGSIGNNTELMMTASQRVLINHYSAELFFGDSETLASAKDFIGHNGVHTAPLKAPTAFYRLIFDQHEIINANGAWTESLFCADCPSSGFLEPMCA